MILIIEYFVICYFSTVGSNIGCMVKNGQIAIKLADDLQPDVILMDVKMPVMDGIEATRRIVGKMPGMKILALSVYSDAIFYKEMMSAGALGYIVKGDDHEDMIKTIHRVARSKKP